MLFFTERSNSRKSYKVCVIETLANYEKISFSEFMKKHISKLDENDKKLLDYYYSIPFRTFSFQKILFWQLKLHY